MSGLICGIRLTKAGQKVAIISSGQSALYFSSGSLALMGHSADGIVGHPLEAIAALPESHPYSRIGLETIKALLPQVKPLFAEAGITLSGSEAANHYRLTPIGTFKPAWLSMLGYATTTDPAKLDWGLTAIAAPAGYVDFYPDFLSHGLNAAGVDCATRSFSLPQLDLLRKSSTEMRATNIARLLTGDAVDDLAAELNRIAAATHADTLLLPAIVGLFDEEPVKKLREKVERPLHFVSTMPMSLGGTRSQILLRKHFRQLGGTCFMGDSVVRGTLQGHRLTAVNTVNLGTMPLEADNFILATGSFFSHGIKSDPDAVYEPIFGLDVNAPTQRAAWCDPDLYKEQPYMAFGVVTDDSLRVGKGGERIDNLRAIGAVLGGCDTLKEGSGGGVAILSAMKAASDILNDK
jgi:glycerol-3-phosphate dehydrogenase subunit B